MDLSLHPQNCHHLPHGVGGRGAAGMKLTHSPQRHFQREAAALQGEQLMLHTA